MSYQSTTEKVEVIAAQLKRERQRENRLTLNLAFQREKLRKADIRRKIQLGGLIVKAGLADESSALVLGLLLDAKAQLTQIENSTCRQHWLKLGQKAFEAHTNNEEN